MTAILRFSAPFSKITNRTNVVWEPWSSQGKEGVSWIRRAIELLPRDTPLTIDLMGAEITPEAIAAIFFFSLDHQDRHGVLEVINMGREAYHILRTMGADDMPMLRVTPAINSISPSLN